MSAENMRREIISLISCAGNRELDLILRLARGLLGPLEDRHCVEKTEAQHG